MPPRTPITLIIGDVFTTAQAAVYLQLSTKTVGDLANRKCLPGRLIKRRWRFHRKTLERWLRVNT